jgi:hypothetical protein
MMPDKSVIQMTAMDHKERLSALLAATEQMVQASGCVPVNLLDLPAYEKGLSLGWEMATFNVLSSGNCKFEAE